MHAPRHSIQTPGEISLIHRQTPLLPHHLPHHAFQPLLSRTIHLQQTKKHQPQSPPWILQLHQPIIPLQPLNRPQSRCLHLYHHASKDEG